MRKIRYGIALAIGGVLIILLGLVALLATIVRLLLSESEGGDPI